MVRETSLWLQGIARQRPEQELRNPAENAIASPHNLAKPFLTTLTFGSRYSPSCREQGRKWPSSQSVGCGFARIVGKACAPWTANNERQRQSHIGDGRFVGHWRSGGKAACGKRVHRVRHIAATRCECTGRDCSHAGDGRVQR